MCHAKRTWRSGDLSRHTRAQASPDIFSDQKRPDMSTPGSVLQRHKHRYRGNSQQACRDDLGYQSVSWNTKTHTDTHIWQIFWCKCCFFAFLFEWMMCVSVCRSAWGVYCQMWYDLSLSFSLFTIHLLYRRIRADGPLQNSDLSDTKHYSMFLRDREKLHENSWNIKPRSVVSEMLEN